MRDESGQQPSALTTRRIAHRKWRSDCESWFVAKDSQNYGERLSWRHVKLFEFGLASTEGPPDPVHSLLSPLLLARHV